MPHPLDHAIASELSYQVAQLRRLRGEDGPCALDSVNRRLYRVPSVIVQRHRFIPDPDLGQDELDETPTWHRHRRKG